MEPYQYAAIVLPEVDLPEAIRITKKGIAANPTEWRLYHHLGYIYWQQGNFQAAGEAYSQGAVFPGAPRWMEAMKARMATEGGSRNLAREIYRRMYEEPGEGKVKEMARLRLMQLDSLDEREAIRRVLTLYQSKTNRCPSAWREIDPSCALCVWCWIQRARLWIFRELHIFWLTLIVMIDLIRSLKYPISRTWQLSLGSGISRLPTIFKLSFVNETQHESNR